MKLKELIGCLQAIAEDTGNDNYDVKMDFYDKDNKDWKKPPKFANIGGLTVVVGVKGEYSVHIECNEIENGKQEG